MWRSFGSVSPGFVVLGLLAGRSVDDIVAALDDEAVTRNKVTARLGKLVKAGTIVKEAVRVDGNKRIAYRLATDAD